MKLSVVIAVYNEEESIRQVYQETQVVLADLVQAEELDSYELIFINDGSHDKTLFLIKEIAEKDSCVRFISFSRNFGRESAILAGLSYAEGDGVLLMDGDLQHPPRLIPQFIAAYKEGYDIVSGKRDRTGESKSATLFAKLFYSFSNRWMDVQLVDGISEFKLLSRRAVQSILALPEYNRFSKGLFAWIGFKEKVIPYQNQVRHAGHSKFHLRASINYALQGLLSFNNSPLRMCMQFGMFCVGLALLYLLAMFFLYFLAPELLVEGYFTTLAAIVLFSGVQLFSIGILGEYIGKIYYEVKRRPHYIIEESNIMAVEAREFEKIKKNEKTGDMT